MRVLAMFAKWPRPGEVKTRLSPPLSLEQAAELYTAMLLDVLDQHATSVERLALWFTPSDAEDWFRAHAPTGYELYVQRGDDLAARMCALFETHAEEGASRVLLRGTDSPTLPKERIAEGFAALDRADVSVCPDRDGGYNLIALARPAPTLFELELSTSSVLAETRVRAREAGLSLVELAPHYDVDTASDLALLRADADRARTPRTRRWLDDHPVPGTDPGDRR